MLEVYLIIGVIIVIIGIIIYSFIQSVSLNKIAVKEKGNDYDLYAQHKERSIIHSIVGNLLLICMAVLIYVGANTTDKVKYIEELPITKIDMIEQLSFEDSVHNYILELNIAHPDIVLKQARIESGNFQSKVFKENNNMFGFKQAFKRPNTQIDVKNGYAIYESWKDCVLDYALYQTYSTKNMTREEYLKFLDKNYAEDPEYLNKIN